jgi:hypothetical protein
MTAYNSLKEQFTNNSMYADRLFYLYDLAYINQLYNMNNGQQALLNGYDSVRYYREISKKFPEINDVLKDKTNYKLQYAMPSWIGASIDDSDVYFSFFADYLIYYKDIAYLMSIFEFRTAPVLFVDDTTPDDKLMEAAKQRIDEYINDSKVKVVIDDVTPTFEPERLSKLYSDLDTYLEAIGSSARHNDNTRIYSLKIGATESPKNLYIIKTNKENIKALEIKAIEKNTGIRLTSTSSISLDSELEASDVTAAYKELNDKVEKAYNISLFSGSKNTYIKSVAGGMKIYIPVADNFISEGLVVAYLDDKGAVQEKFDFSIETVDGQKYVTFVTNHLSVYGIVKDGEQNPNTADYLVIMLGVLAVTTVLLIIANHTKVRRYE